MIKHNTLNDSSFFYRQMLTIRITFWLSTLFNLFFLIVGLYNRAGTPILNGIYILISCIPTYYFLRKQLIELAKYFIYFPSIIILSIMAYMSIKNGLAYGNLENLLIPVAIISAIAFDNRARKVGLFLNILFLLSLKVIRLQSIQISYIELYSDIMVVIVTYVTILACGYLYRIDFQILTKKNAEMQKQKQIIEQQAINLQATNNIKDRIFSVISHDLRSPIIALKGILQLHDANNISQEQFKALSKKVQENVDNIHLMLDNLLIWSFSQIRGIKPKFVNIKLRSIIEEIATLYNEMLFQKNIELINNFTLDLEVLGDEQQIKIVFRNLLNNALKFTNTNGRITINAYQQRGFIVITVEDNGIGIGQEDVENVFSEPKLKLGTNGESGTGLGLSLCKEIVLNHKGVISIYSKLGYGTTVELKFPRNS